MLHVGPRVLAEPVRVCHRSFRLTLWGVHEELPVPCARGGKGSWQEGMVGRVLRRSPSDSQAGHCPDGPFHHLPVALPFSVLDSGQRLRVVPGAHCPSPVGGMGV